MASKEKGNVLYESFSVLGTIYGPNMPPIHPNQSNNYGDVNLFASGYNNMLFVRFQTNLNQIQGQLFFLPPPTNILNKICIIS